jgi:hypothetical protein
MLRIGRKAEVADRMTRPGREAMGNVTLPVDDGSMTAKHTKRMHAKETPSATPTAATGLNRKLLYSEPYHTRGRFQNLAARRNVVDQVP